ncbi:MAG: c-type cytochrome [Verrucomicrobiales bacterium]|nr:c-type cytochrome [Verrucomicrobiales bacterium]
MREPIRIILATSLLLPAAVFGAPRFDPSGFRTDPRLELTLWAAEPDVVDPVSICWDAAGRAYVAECRDYPLGVGPDGKVGSTLRRLEDTDGDGVPDHSVLFARDLSFVTSVTPWRGGILAAAAPDILFLKDTDGDGVADVREVVLTGFTRGVSDSLVNGLRFGPDNRIHGANGGNGGSLVNPRTPGVVLRLGDDDFSFNPETGDVVRTGRSGGGFGLVFDDFGRAFTTYNINHLQHRFLLRRHAERYPGFPPADLTASVSDHGEMSEIFPISAAVTRPNHPEQAGHFSAAGGLGILLSDAFPQDLRGSLLVGDVVGNLLHRDVLQSDGPGFSAGRAPAESRIEFFSSRDPAVRPVAAETGPDGALYILDMQRDVIEHPDYIPEKVRRQLDLRAGADRGRIYRLFPTNAPRVAPARPALDTADLPTLVATLGHPNSWWRQTARRLLVERADVAAEEPVRRAATQNTSATGRVAALWTLRGIHRLRAEDVLAGLQDPASGVRENGMILAEEFLNDSRVRAAVCQVAADPDARVRFQAALALGVWNDPRSIDALAKILIQDVSHRWTRLAVLASLPPEGTVPLLTRLLTLAPFRSGATDAHRAALSELCDLAGARAATDPGVAGAAIECLSLDLPGDVQTRMLDALAEGLTRAGARPAPGEAARKRLEELGTLPDAEVTRALWRLTRALGIPASPSQEASLSRARLTAGTSAEPVPARVAAVRMLAMGLAAGSTNVLLHCLDAREPLEIQSAALGSLASFRDPALGAALVSRWRAVSPTVRSPLLVLLLDRRPYHDPLLSALEAGTLTVGELNLDLEQRRRLLRGSSGIRDRASRFFGDEEYSNRKSVVSEWLSRLPASGDATRGKTLFLETCARCHVAGSVGTRVGPDLSGVAHRSSEDLLSNILDPNMAINPGFVACTIETREGEVQTGLLASETRESLTLLQAGGERIVIPRNQLVRVESGGLSLMPEGLEQGRTPQDLRDLIAFLQSEP